jgi:hypothetical protein
MTIIAKDSSKVSGEYAGFAGGGRLADSLLPVLNEPIVVIDTFGNSGKYLFKGFYYHRTGDTYIPRINVLKSSLDIIMPLDLHGISEIRKDDGGIIGRAQIIRSFSGQSVPQNSMLLVRDSIGISSIALDNISRIDLPVKNNAAIRGFLIGLGIDLLIAIEVIYSLRGMNFD